MKNFYKNYLLNRIVVPAIATGLLLLSGAEAATAQKNRPALFSKVREHATQPLPTKREATTSVSTQSLARLAAATTSAQPLTSMHYSPNGANWRHETTNTYTYDGAGLVTSITEKSPTGSNLTRETWTYDQYGNETENKYENWNGSQWELNGGWRTAYTYNAGGKVTESIESNWSNNRWELRYRSVVAYNAAGNFESLTGYDRDGSNWLVEESYTLTYANANSGPTSLLYMEPNRDGVLVNTERTIDIVWHTFSTNVTFDTFFDQPVKSYLNQVWENGQWVNEEKYDAVFGDNNSFVGIEQEWENGAWVNSWRITVNFDAWGNQTLGQDEERENGNWVIYGANKYTHTYNSANNLTETIRQNWDEQTRAFSNTERIVYSNFQTVTSAPLAAEELIASVYPNPTADKITLSYKQLPGRATLQVTDMTGRTVFKKQLGTTAEQQELDLSNFPAGLYMLQLSTADAVATRKVLKL
ncbi:T9SS type A sorting domain-containing protein [Pontibacter qinzhouensis]|uniref:T9SS type A sorting domain-containing protein n=1 Tax=Pontibacter qinzhouensis TaxID=2603253 RepID=A0A5C8JKV4_9BACT|nr:T9SS type A sorting domain-containing protein [Pontibacter qinzhouensis]TXK37493.1 T9SS type A sorting domain-containing protein [Pontibacter qinzhouensis]